MPCPTGPKLNRLRRQGCQPARQRDRPPTGPPSAAGASRGGAGRIPQPRLDFPSSEGAAAAAGYSRTTSASGTRRTNSCCPRRRWSAFSEFRRVHCARSGHYADLFLGRVRQRKSLEYDPKSRCQNGDYRRASPEAALSRQPTWVFKSTRRNVSGRWLDIGNGNHQSRVQACGRVRRNARQSDRLRLGNRAILR